MTKNPTCYPSLSLSRRTYCLLIDEVYKHNIQHNWSIGVVGAATAGQLRAVERFIARSLDIHLDFHDPRWCRNSRKGVIGNALWQACEANVPTEVIAGLVKGGVDLFGHTFLKDQSWLWSIRPLHLALLHQNLPTVRLLLDHGAKMDERVCFGPRTFPLHLASYIGPLELVQLLLEYGADPELLDEDLNTPLHYAAGVPYYVPDPDGEFVREGGRCRRLTSSEPLFKVPGVRNAVPAESEERTKIMKLLLELGAEPGAKNKAGIRAWIAPCLVEAWESCLRA